MAAITGTTFAGRDVGDAVEHDLVSTTYHATEPEGGGPVRLRVVADDLCQAGEPDSELYQRFLRRAAAALTFEHPNAARVEEVGADRGRGYVVSTHVPAVALHEWINAHGPLPLDEALPLFFQIADVLDALHRRGLTHGAVNPTTLHIATDDGGQPVPYLTGYGIGALIELRLRRDRRRLQIVDDLLYVAPEQLRQQPLTGRTDQYALACAIVHVLSGAPPFARNSVGGLFGAHLFVDADNDPARPWTLAVTKAMAKQPRARYATCTHLVEDIVSTRRRATGRRGLAARRAMSRAVQPGRSEPPARDTGDDRDGRDMSATAAHRQSRMAYAASAEDVGPAVTAKSGPPGDADDGPPLSEVLRGRPPDREPAGWRPPGILVMLVMIALAAAAVAVWMVGT